MGMTDPIADMLTRIRNGQGARKVFVDMPASGVKKQIAEILEEEGYVKSSEMIPEEGNKMTLRIYLKYHENQPVIEAVTRASKPGRRMYVGKKEIPVIYSGLGIAILSTSQGVVSSRKAMELGVGGEVLCTVF